MKHADTSQISRDPDQGSNKPVAAGQGTFGSGTQVHF